MWHISDHLPISLLTSVTYDMSLICDRCQQYWHLSHIEWQMSVTDVSNDTDICHIYVTYHMWQMSVMILTYVTYMWLARTYMIWHIWYVTYLRDYPVWHIDIPYMFELACDTEMWDVFNMSHMMISKICDTSQHMWQISVMMCHIQYRRHIITEICHICDISQHMWQISVMMCLRYCYVRYVRASVRYVT